MRKALMLASLFLLAGLAGCISDDPTSDPTPASAPDFSNEDFVMEGVWSQPLSPREFPLETPYQEMVAVRDGVEMAIGIFLPDIPGCDWSSTDLPESCHLPVVMDAGPYYVDRVDIDKGRPQWVEWLVPRGYAVVQMALRGTGESGGCMGFKDPMDATDISDVVDWIAEQPWSNGNVGVAGRSYDGTSAWAAAASGNPHVKTIVPISGAVNAPQLYFRNGTHELRALIPHIPTYWASYALGTSGDDPLYRGTDILVNVCPDVLTPHIYGPLSAVTGDASSDYWQSRDLRQDIVDNYEGSVWVIHGMVDWNVDPSQAVPFLQDLQAADIPTLAWLGQWAHAYPDHSPEHINVRWDWAHQLELWFDHYLRDEGAQPWLGVEVERDDYQWHQLETFPAQGEDLRIEFSLGNGVITPLNPVTIPLETPTTGTFSGLSGIELTVTPTTVTGGSLAVELFDVTAGKRVGWGVLNLQYHQGGNTNPQTLTPGSPLTVRVQFEPTHSLFVEGNSLELRIGKDGVQDINPSLDPSPVIVTGGAVSGTLLTDVDGVSIPLGENDFRRPA